MQEKIIILDFGSQTTQLIGRRLRELNVYCEIVPYNKFPHEDESVKGVILSGSPYSVYDESAFKVDLSNIRGKYPILGICYGAQFISYSNGGKGVILSGSPYSVYDESAFKVDLSNIRGKYPILGICYGAQFISYSNGGKVEPAGTREYGRAHLAEFDKENLLFHGIKEHSQVWMSHGDTITAIPESRTCRDT